jgi:murein DD-endopeptidase MepM/ murein hydrolase activator NlpD
MEKKETINLYLEKPCSAEVNLKGGQFGASRRHGPHKGLDFKAYKKPVHASENGVVVYSGVREGSITWTNYGHTIVIDHTPGIPDDGRHIYTLYGHLDKRSAYRGQRVRKGDTVGISGNSGTMAYYKELPQSYHLHFEVIDADRSFDWSTGWPGDLRKEHRKDPENYLGRATTIEYDLSDMIEKSAY